MDSNSAAARCLCIRSSSASPTIEQQQQQEQQQQPATASRPPPEFSSSQSALDLPAGDFDFSSDRATGLPPLLILESSAHMSSDREPTRSSLSPDPKRASRPDEDPTRPINEEALLPPSLPPPPIQTPIGSSENVDLRELLASLPALGMGGAAVGTAEEHVVLAYLARSLRALEQLGLEDASGALAHSQRFQPLASITEDEGNSPSRGIPNATFKNASVALTRPLSLIDSSSSITTAAAATTTAAAVTVISSTSSAVISKGSGGSGHGAGGGAGRPRSLNLSSAPLPAGPEALSFRTPGHSNESEHKYLHPHHQQRVCRGGGSGSGGPTNSAPNTPIDHFTRSIQSSKAASGSGTDNGVKSPTKSSSRSLKDALASKLAADESNEVPPEELRSAGFIQRCLEGPDLPKHCTLNALASHLRAIAPSDLFGVVGWTSLELEAFLLKHKTLFALEGTSGAMSVSVRKRLSEEAVQKATATGGPNELLARCAQVYHVARSWGILNLGRHEHVFFDRSLFRDPAAREAERGGQTGSGGSDSDANAIDLTRLFRVGERVYFDAVLAGRGSRAKWRATRVWKAPAAIDGSSSGGGSNNQSSGFDTRTTGVAAVKSPVMSTKIEPLKKGPRGVHFADITPTLIQSPLCSIATIAIHQSTSEAACQTLATGDILATRLFNAELNSRLNPN